MTGPLSEKRPLSEVSLSKNLLERLGAICEEQGRPISAVVEEAVKRYLLDPREHAVFLSAPVDAMMKGLYEENTTIGELKRHGDFGLGTFNDLDGEMVMLDGRVYQLQDDGCAHPVDDDVQTPFACVTFFEPTTVEEIDEELDYIGFRNLLDRLIASENMFFALRMDGEFKRVSGWTVPRQENYSPIAEVKPTPFNFQDAAGTLAGFYSPRFIKSLVIPGYHLHFLSADRKKGGHLHQCEPKRLRVCVQFIAKLELNLPITVDYLTAKLT